MTEVQIKKTLLPMGERSPLRPPKPVLAQSDSVEALSRDLQGGSSSSDVSTPASEDDTTTTITSPAANKSSGSVCCCPRALGLEDDQALKIAAHADGSDVRRPAGPAAIEHAPPPSCIDLIVEDTIVELAQMKRARESRSGVNVLAAPFVPPSQRGPAAVTTTAGGHNFFSVTGDASPAPATRIAAGAPLALGASPTRPYPRDFHRAPPPPAAVLYQETAPTTSVNASGYRYSHARPSYHAGSGGVLSPYKGAPGGHHGHGHGSSAAAASLSERIAQEMLLDYSITEAISAMAPAAAAGPPLSTPPPPAGDVHLRAVVPPPAPVAVDVAAAATPARRLASPACSSPLAQSSVSLPQTPAVRHVRHDPYSYRGTVPCSPAHHRGHGCCSFSEASSLTSPPSLSCARTAPAATGGSGSYAAAPLLAAAPPPAAFLVSRRSGSGSGAAPPAMPAMVRVSSSDDSSVASHGSPSRTFEDPRHTHVLRIQRQQEEQRRRLQEAVSEQQQAQVEERPAAGEEEEKKEEAPAAPAAPLSFLAALRRPANTAAAAATPTTVVAAAHATTAATATAGGAESNNSNNNGHHHHHNNNNNNNGAKHNKSGDSSPSPSASASATHRSGNNNSNHCSNKKKRDNNNNNNNNNNSAAKSKGKVSAVLSNNNSGAATK